MDAPNHYHIYGITEKIFAAGEPVEREFYAAFQESRKNNFETSIVTQHRGTEGIDRSALERLAHEVVAYQVKKRSFGEPDDFTLAFTFKPVYDVEVVADCEQRMFELNGGERDAFIVYARTKLLSIKEP